jgi:Zn ribbon nucleic-acid-binding protein
MAVKPPSYAIQNIFSRVIPEVEQVKTSNRFILRGKCPFCQDYKKRMYCLEYGDHFQVVCHNCGYNNPFSAFIKNDFPAEQTHLKEFIIDSIKTGDAFKPRSSSKREIIPVIENDLKLRTYLADMSFCLGERQELKMKEQFRSLCIDYCEGRRIPKKYWSEFVFFTKGKLKGYIGIPMWDDNKNNILHVQGRLFAEDKTKEDQQKYMFLKDEDHYIGNIPKPIYGTWRVNKDIDVYICEGTLDCLAFGDQGVATCGATISEFFINKVRNKFPNRVWCMDNYWDDEEGHKLTDKLLDMGERCFIIPKKMNSKDSNALLEEIDVNILPEDFVNENIYQGRLGKVKLGLLK